MVLTSDYHDIVAKLTSQQNPYKSSLGFGRDLGSEVLVYGLSLTHTKIAKSCSWSCHKGLVDITRFEHSTA